MRSPRNALLAAAAGSLLVALPYAAPAGKLARPRFDPPPAAAPRDRAMPNRDGRTDPLVPSAERPGAELPKSAGPRGTSGEVRYDAVGEADVDGETGSTGVSDGSAAVTLSHAALPVGSIVEVTSLANGRTILALVEAPTEPLAWRIGQLSAAAAAMLRQPGPTGAVRIRLVDPTPQDRHALEAGRAASGRIDAPEALLVGLRKRMPPHHAPIVAAKDPVRRLPAARPPAGAPERPAPPAGTYAAAPAVTDHRGGSSGSFVVQVAALSSETRAAALSAQLGGRVIETGGIHRVQLGPFRDRAAARRARDAAARRGYGDAEVVAATGS